MSDVSRVAKSAIQALCLDSLGSHISAQFMQSGRRRWVVPCRANSSVSNRSSCCPMCLVGDATPYFRLAWRFAFITHCPLHGCPLSETCASCGGGMWPASQRILLERVPSAFSNCQCCGETIGGAGSVDSEMQEIARSLWLCATLGAVPREMPQAANAQEVFDALWVMAQLLLRSGARQIWRVLPSSFQTSEPFINHAHNVEQLPSPQRARIINAACWLLSSWPANFHQATSAAKITKFHFSVTWDIQPAWLSSYIRENLSVKRRGLTEDEVRSAISQLEDDGLAVTKSSLRRALKVTESRAIHTLVKHRHRATREEFTTFCAAVEQRITEAPRSRDQKATLSRDYLILLLSVLSDKSMETVCKMTHAEVALLLKQLHSQSFGNSVPPAFHAALECAKNLAENEEPLICAQNTESTQRFIGRFGDELAGHTVRDRFAKMMRLELGQELWNSVDAFLGIYPRYEL